MKSYKIRFSASKTTWKLRIHRVAAQVRYPGRNIGSPPGPPQSVGCWERLHAEPSNVRVLLYVYTGLAWSSRGSRVLSPWRGAAAPRCAAQALAGAGGWGRGAWPSPAWIGGAWLRPVTVEAGGSGGGLHSVHACVLCVRCFETS